MDFKQEIINLIVNNTSIKEEIVFKMISVPPDAKLGDYAFPCFPLGKDAKIEAEKLKEKLELPKFITKVEVAGPYLNFFLNQTYLAQFTLEEVYKQAKHYGSNKVSKSKKVVVEFCGPNTNKPLHLGHLRNMALGSAMCNILSFYGHQIIPVNIVNDRGIHICQSMLAYQKWGKNKEPDKKGDHFVGDYYVMYSQEAKNKLDLKDQAQELLLKWENGDVEVQGLWKKMNTWVLDGFKQTYQRFGISFDKEYFESRYYSCGKEIVLDGLNNGSFEKDDTGAIISNLEKLDLPNKVLLRSDGTSIYITQDMYLADMRYNDYKYNQMIYVVASEQRLHFKQLFAVLKQLKKPYAENMYHLSYGLVHLPSGRMKSREGTVIDADNIMDETAAIAKKEIKKRHQELSEKECNSRAEIISLGAIKFFMTKTDATKDIVFNSEESMNFEGETGPYVQYTHARICSILRKSKQEHQSSVILTINFSLLNLDEELKILKLIYNFPDVMKKAAESYKPHHIAQYLISLSQAFNEFYHKCPVISEVRGQMKARLLLIDCVRQILNNGLGLLGIEAPQEM